MPWIAKDTFVFVKHKQKLFSSFYADGNQSEKKFYKQYLNELLTTLQALSKKLFYVQEFRKCSKDHRKA